MARKKAQRLANANLGPTTSRSSQSPPNSSHGGARDGQMHRDGTSLEGGEIDLKRKSNNSESIQQQKRLRMESSPTPDSDSPNSSARGL